MPATPIHKFMSSGDFVHASERDGRVRLIVGVDDLDGVDDAELTAEEAAELGLWLLRRSVDRLPTSPLQSLAGLHLDNASRIIGDGLR